MAKWKRQKGIKFKSKFKCKIGNDREDGKWEMEKGKWEMPACRQGRGDGKWKILNTYSVLSSVLKIFL